MIAIWTINVAGKNRLFPTCSLRNRSEVGQYASTLYQQPVTVIKRERFIRSH